MKKIYWSWVVLVAIIVVVLFPSAALAETIDTYDLELKLVDSRGQSSTGGTLSYASFPQTFYVTASTPGVSTNKTISVKKPNGQTVETNKFTVTGGSDMGTYIITAKTTGGAVKEIAVHVKYEVKAEDTSTYKYRTVALQISSVKLGDTQVMSGLNTRINLVGGTALAPDAEQVLANLIKKTDGQTYTLEGSLVIEVYSARGVVGTYVIKKDWQRLLSDYDWVPNTIDAFRTMQDASTVYQAPQLVEMRVEWRDADKSYKVLEYISHKEVIAANQWLVMSAYVTDKELDDKYNHVFSGIVVRHADGRVYEEHDEPRESMTAQGYSNMECVTITFDFKVPNNRDLELIAPEQPSYPEGEDVVSWVYLSLEGKDITPWNRVTAVIEIPELSYTYQTVVTCKENSTIKIPFKWHTPDVTATKSVTIRAQINKSKVIAESTYDNNVVEFEAQIMNMNYNPPAETGPAYPAPPSRSTLGKITWTEQRYEGGKIVNKEYYVRLRVTAEIDYTTEDAGYIRSGYGFGLVMNYSIETNYDKPDLITDCQVAKVALPQYTYWKYSYMERVDQSSWQLAPHADSPAGNRKQYVPVWWADDEPYIIQAMCGEVYTPGGVLNCWVTGSNDSQLSLNIEGSMYDDDHIGY